ncbi:hypothetical protein QBC38DRAFT_465038 [Podospora fimiseda]|uniref:Uncharacterized protein n=1 Tax=Podospora fimiseda TaxID=252190 RepID=A0AAN7BYH7_9PEZI|nr:hypothetical protein QBC38DRAFT_465038 [Podospora fimiseda]
MVRGLVLHHHILVLVGLLWRVTRFGVDKRLFFFVLRCSFPLLLGISNGIVVYLKR